MKKVTMFVWNHFTNDARVMRECLTLSENQYDVNLIAINNKDDMKAVKSEKINENFKVHRVRMYPLILEVYQKNKLYFLMSIAVIFIFLTVLLYYFSLFLLVTYISLVAILLIGMNNMYIRRNFIKVVRSVRMIKKGFLHNADVYHSNDLNTLTQGVICSKFRLNKKKLIYDSHEVHTDRTGYNKKMVSIWEKALIKYVDEVIVENYTRADYHKQLYGVYPKTLYNYSSYYEVEKIQAGTLRKKLDIHNDEKILLYQGGLQSGRGLELLIKAMPKINEGTLVFIGDGNLKNVLKRQVADADLKNRIKFLPKVYLENLPNLTKDAYLGFQVLQNTSYNHFSASSNKLFEYIMAHVPVISCDFPEIKKVVDSEKIGISIDASNIDEIAKAVNILLSDEDTRNEYSKNCAKAKMKYNWNNEKNKLIKIYENI